MGWIQVEPGRRFGLSLSKTSWLLKTTLVLIFAECHL